MKKGNTISQFLQKCIEQLRKDFTEFRYVDAALYSRIFNIVIRASVDNSNFVFIITEGITLFLNKSI